MNQELLELEELLNKGLERINIVDARSPSEFAEDHIPGAVNIPLLDDDERREVGTCYKQQGPQDARMLGVKLVSPKLPDFIDRYFEVKRNNRLTVVYCWRGGLRSAASVGLVRLAGFNVFRLNGGYKSFRGHINSFFDNFDPAYRFITVYGPTGCAKTEILRSMKGKEYPVADLEAAACHKGSTFGNVDEPGYPAVTQKSFETSLWHEFYESGAKTFLTEGESRKIGKVSIPGSVFERMGEGVSVLLDAPMEFRIRFTIENYKPELYLDEITESLMNIKRYLGKNRVAELKGMLDAGDYETFTKVLLDEYYDPMYRRSFPEAADHVIRINSLEEGERLLSEIYKSTA